MGMTGKITLGVVVGVVVLGAVSTNSGDDGNGGDSGGDKATSASADRKPGGDKDSAQGGEVAEKKAAFAGDGDFQVGSDIKPGTYRTSGNTDHMCYWERAKDASGELDALLANDNVSGTSYVTVEAGDKIFRSSGCSDWEAVDPKAKGSPGAKMAGDGGMFKVGTDIAPGTYRSAGNSDDMCYWERSKDAEHSLDSIIANNNVSGNAVVTISSSDAYFKTSGCEDWKKTG
ncbi:hypothetical protein ADL00_45565 [Streptomyces sp. AS58]|uniref:Uncharacterized protein n=2 Tax=Streptomyces TaxID=1883 RepID=A0A2Z4J2F7_9ACTN|nr:hypothetical protein [Streptomyces cadmiisoli]AWW39180.1 hypothetical protein DN051_23050 [Streptomyces cadmiisoli]KOV49604.1 hypothetical protein ADL00_45565 [Streptomyces sp. AS58]